MNLKIFNLLGEDVGTLVSERLSAGSYSNDWDASKISSGIFLYQLNVGVNKKIKKMLLIK